MDNPFEIICQRLDAIQNLLLEMKAANEITAATGGDNGGLDGLLTKKQAAALINCSVSSIDNFRRAGKIRPHYVGKKAVRFKASDILALAGY